MSEEIVLIEEENKKGKILKLILKKERLGIKFVIKLPVVIYSLFIFIFSSNLFVLLYGIFSYLLITILSNLFTLFFFTKIYKKENDKNYGRLYYTELGYTPAEYNELILSVLFTSIMTFILNFVLFSIFLNDIGSNLANLLILLIISIIPFLLLGYLLILPAIKEGEFTSKISRELPVASMFITAFSAANIHPYSAINTLGKLRLFPSFNRIYRQIERLKTFLAIGPIDAISLYAKIVRDESVKKLLQAISAISLGSGIYTIMKEYMKETFKVFEKKIEEFIDRFNVLLAAQLIVFILLPIASMMTLLFMQGNTFSMLFATLFLIPSVFFILFFFMIQGYALPFLRMGLKHDSRVYLLLLPPIVFFILNFMGFLNLSMTFFSSAMFLLIGYYLLHRKSSIENERLLNELPNIVRDLAEEVKKGNSLYQAIDKIHERYEYAGDFLRKISLLRMLGISVEEILEKEKLPSFFKQVFIALEECDKVALDSATMEEFADFVYRLDSIRKIYKMRTKFFRFSSYMITALLGFSLGISLAVLGSLVSTFNIIAQASTMVYSFNLLNLNIPFSSIKELVSVAGYLNSIFLGFLGGYAEGNSVEGAKNAILCGMICFISLSITNMMSIFQVP